MTFPIRPLLVLLALFAGCDALDARRGEKEEEKPFSGMLPIVEDGKLGFMDASGKVLIRPQFLMYTAGLLDMDPFSGELAPLPTGNKWGYVDRTGRYVVNPQFESAAPFEEGLARVTLRNKVGFIDRTGGYVVNPQFDDAADFSEGLAAVRLGAKWGYINTEGEYVVNPQFEYAGAFEESVARVVQNGRWGYIDREGVFKINPQFDEAGDFREGTAVVRAGDRWGTIDDQGKYVVQPQFEGASEKFSEGLWRVQMGGKWGYVDESGKILINPQFDQAYDLKGGLAMVRSGDAWGYIDRTGKYRINPQFDEAQPFAEGRARVGMGGKYGYIDPDGKLVVSARFAAAASRFRSGRAWVVTDEGLGYVDPNGQYVRRPTPVARPTSMQQLAALLTEMPAALHPSILAAARGHERELIRSALPSTMGSATILGAKGSTAQGALTPGSRSYYAVMPGPDESWSAFVTAPDVDTYLIVHRLVGDGSAVQVAVNDDYRSTRDSRVDLDGTASLQAYVVEVRAYNPSSAGRYTIGVGPRESVESLTLSAYSDAGPAVPASPEDGEVHDGGAMQGTGPETLQDSSSPIAYTTTTVVDAPAPTPRVRLKAQSAQHAVDVWARSVRCGSGCSAQVVAVYEEPGGNAAEVELEIRRLPNPRGSSIGSVFDPDNPPRVVIGPASYSGRETASFRRGDDGRWVFSELYILALDARWRPSIPVQE